ncbi:uncharacterized protein LOC115650119 [Gopherus evgoodei]|uniref:uncharacterized protein LOC115650119 n=1 Tax=Gopherus evgoodei TaxID=1825980 RepID=UPI0011D011A5|nr:uncharacterized protein LOC115650119 [Gopherus evgoodei]
MSCRDHHCKTSSAPIYVSTVEVMLSSSRVTPPPTFESAVQGRPFQKMPSSAWYLPAGQSATESTRRNVTLPPSNISSGVYCSRLDVILAQTNRRKVFRKDNPCMNLSDMASACSNLHRDSWGSGCGSFGIRSTPTSCKQCSVGDQSACHSSTDKNGPMKLSVSLPSAASSSKAPPSWTSRLDVALSAIPAVSPLHSKRMHATLASRSSAPPQRGYSQCSVPIPDLHASVKLYISTCSLAIKPFRTDTQVSNHAHSSLLVPQLEKMPGTSAGLPTGSQVSKQDFSSPGSPALQITRFHVTSSAECPGLPQQTVSREIWLTPAALTRRESSVGGREVPNTDLNPDLIIFQNNPSSETAFGNTPCERLTPAHHKISKITLILATPWTTVPIHVVREFRKSPAPTIFIKSRDLDAPGPPLHPIGIGAGLSLSVNPVCCPELLSSQQRWATSGSRPSQDACTVGTIAPENLLTNIPACTANVPHRAGRGAWCPSFAVNIASFGAGRRVVKISIPF